MHFASVVSDVISIDVADAASRSKKYTGDKQQKKDESWLGAIPHVPL
jgi:hypothetical protein